MTELQDAGKAGISARLSRAGSALACRCTGAGCGRGASNQSAALADTISASSGVAVLHGVLKRVRATPQQVGLTKSQRADNVQGAFRVAADGRAAVAGKRLVLVDDVLTSGATADTCARALLRAGAAAVDVLVFARVVAPIRTPI
jgi:predicted amidophosphoribosyltransferase